MLRHPILILVTAFFSALVGSALIIDAPSDVRADVGGVSSNAPWFTKGDVLTITVSAEDDDGELTIISNLPGSRLTVEECDDIGVQVEGQCDASGIDAVDGDGSEYITIDTEDLDTDEKVELMTVRLSLRASCNEPTVVTITANSPGNVGPDDVTVNCVPPTPTPTPTRTPTRTPTPTSTPIPTFTPNPSVTPFVEVSSGTPPPVITPPSTGDGGIR